MSLGQKITVIVILMILFTSFIQGFSSYRNVISITESSLKRYSDTLVDASLDTIKEWISGTKGILSSLQNEKFEDLTDVEQDLQQATDAEGAAGIYIGRANGQFIQNSKASDVPDDYDPRTRPWYTETIQSKNEYVFTDPYQDDTGVIMITVATKSKHEKNTVIAADIPLTSVSDIVSELKSDLASAVLLTDKGIILAYENNEFLLKKSTDIAPTITTNLLKAMNVPDNDIEPFKTKVNNQTVLVTSQSLPETGWYLLLIVNHDLAYAQSRKQVIDTILISLISTVFSALIIAFFIRFMLNRLASTNIAIAELSKGEGDLTLRLSSKGSDEVAELASNVNLFIAKLHTIISEIVSSGQKVREQSLAFTDMAQQSQESLASQKDEVSQIATAVNEMSATAQEVANNAEATASATVMSAEHCAKGKTVILHNRESITGLANKIDETSQAMGELESNTQNINNILLSIQGIAEQTNLLALNAAIEAARAGEQGRGFAVVADEVRVLSQRTQGSTEEIRAMIETLLENTDNAVRTMHESRALTDESVEQANDAVAALEKISDSIKKIADMSTQIASAAEEQRAVTEEVNRNTQSVSNSSDQMVLAAGDILEMSNQLGDVANGLNKQVGLFKL